MNFNFILFPDRISSYQFQNNRIQCKENTFIIKNNKVSLAKKGKKLEGIIFYLPVIDDDDRDYIPIHYIQSSNYTNKFLFQFHGNAEDIGECQGMIKALFNNQFLSFESNIVVIEQPGYGLYKYAKPSEELFNFNGLQVQDWFRSYFNIDESNIVVFGRSIGTGVAINLCTKRNPNSLILLSPFTNIKDVAYNFVGKLSFLIRERFNNIQNIKKVKSRCLIIHGLLDTVVPQQHGELLYNNLDNDNSNELMLIENMDHNNLNLDDIRFKIQQFLKSSFNFEYDNHQYNYHLHNNNFNIGEDQLDYEILNEAKQFKMLNFDQCIQQSK